MNAVLKPIASGLKYFWLNMSGTDTQSRFFCKASLASQLRKEISFEEEIKRIRRILIILPDRTYDAALVQNMISSLKARRRSQIEVVAESGAKDLIKSNPDIDGGFFIHGHEYKYNHRSFTELCLAVQQKRYDACFLLKQDATPLDLYLAAMSRAPLRVGFHSPHAFPFLNLCIRPAKMTERERDKYESVFRTIGIKILKTEIAWNLPRTAEKDAEGVLAEAGVNFSNPIIGINLTPSVSGKKFSSQFIAALITELSKMEKCSIVLFHAGYQDDEMAKLATSIGKASINYPPHHITFAAAMSRKISLTITLNNLFYQIATTTGNKVVGLFESLEHRRWAVIENGKLVQCSSVSLDTMSIDDIIRSVTSMLVTSPAITL